MGTDCDVRAAVERPEEDAVDFLIAAREEAIYRERCAEACTEVLSPHRYLLPGRRRGRALARCFATGDHNKATNSPGQRSNGVSDPGFNSCSAIDLKRTGVDSEAI